MKINNMKMSRALSFARLLVITALLFAVVVMQYFTSIPPVHAATIESVSSSSLLLTKDVNPLGESSSPNNLAIDWPLTNPDNNNDSKWNESTGGYYDFHEGDVGDSGEIKIENPEKNTATSCKWYQLGCHIKSIFNGFFDMIWSAVAKAVGNFVAWSFTYSLAVPLTGPLTTYMELGDGKIYNPLDTKVTIPDVFTFNRGGVRFTIADLIGWIKWFTGIAAVIMLIVYFGRLAWARQSGQGFEVSKALFWIGVGCLITASACALVPQIMTASPAWRGPVGWITQQLWPITGIVLVIGLIITAFKIITDQNGKPLKEFAQLVMIVLAVANLGGAVVLLLSSIGDSLSIQIIKNSLKCSVGNNSPSTSTECFGDAIINLFNALGPLGWLVLFVVCLIALVAGLIQILIMQARAMMLIFVLGGLTLAAAFRYTKIGKESFEKSIGWIVALLLYKPVVAIIYGVAFKFMGAANIGSIKDSLGVQTGAALRNLFYFLVAMILAIFALPALMKLVTPAVSAMAEGSSGVASVISAAAGVAQTAMMGMRMAGGDPTAAAEVAGAAGAAGGGAAAGGGSGTIGRPGGGGGGAPGTGGGGGGGDGFSANLDSISGTGGAQGAQSTGGGGGGGGGGNQPPSSPPTAQGAGGAPIPG